MDDNKVYYLRNMQKTRTQRYEDKHKDLIALIDSITQGDQVTTIIVTSQVSLGDNPSEFAESLRRLREAEIALVISDQEYHTAELDINLIPWKG